VDSPRVCLTQSKLSCLDDGVPIFRRFSLRHLSICTASISCSPNTPVYRLLVYYLIHTTCVPCLLWLLSEVNLISHHLSSERSVSGSRPLHIHPTRIPCHLDLERTSLPMLLSFSLQPPFSITCLPTEACLSLPFRILVTECHLGINERHCVSSSIAGIRVLSVRSSVVIPA
jgi:hypothetical protein